MKSRTMVKTWWFETPVTKSSSCLCLCTNVYVRNRNMIAIPNIENAFKEGAINRYGNIMTSSNIENAFKEGTISTSIVVRKGEWVSKLNIDFKMTPAIFEKLFPFTMLNTDRTYL